MRRIHTLNLRLSDVNNLIIMKITQRGKKEYKEKKRKGFYINEMNGFFLFIFF